MLARSPALVGCASETFDMFCERGKIGRFNDGEVLASRGEAMESLVFVLQGSIEIGVFTGHGRRFVARYMEPGQLLGIIPILDGGGAIHDVQAHGEVAALLIPRATFAGAIDADPGLSQALLHLFCARSRIRYDDAMANALASVRVRVARTLVSLLPAYGLPRGNAVRIDLRLSQEEFATLVGVSRQRANKELNDFRAIGLISTSYSRIEVIDYKALHEIASLDMLAAGQRSLTT